MKINIINGSPKVKGSNTEIILNELNTLIPSGHEVRHYKIDKKIFSDAAYNEIVSGDIIILAFPLFNDCLPSNTLRLIVELERLIMDKEIKNLIIYTIINNGLYEGKQTHIAFEIIKNWCEHTGVKFGGGIGQGAGEMLDDTRNIPISKGPFINLHRALTLMAEKMCLKEQFEIIYLNPYFPRFLYSFMATRSWNKRALKNNLTKTDVLKKYKTKNGT